MPEVILLAGGLGTRLRSVLHDTPKCMASINGRPFLEYLLDYILRWDVERFIMAVGYKGDQIIDHFGELYKATPVIYSVESIPLGTGGGIMQALSLCKYSPVVVLNGDTLFAVNLRQLLDQHHNANAGMSIALRKVDDVSRYGEVIFDAKCKINVFGEKQKKQHAGFINGGVYIIDPAVYLSVGSRGVFSLENDLFPILIEKQLLFGFPYDDYFLDIGIPEDYRKAQHEFKSLEY